MISGVAISTSTSAVGKWSISKQNGVDLLSPLHTATAKDWSLTSLVGQRIEKPKQMQSLMAAIIQILRNCCCKGIVRLHRYDSGPDFGEGWENIWHVRLFSDGGKAVAMSHIVCGQHCQWHLRTHSSKWWVKNGEYSRPLRAENFVVQSNAMICLGGQRHLWSSCKILGVSSLTTIVYLGWPCMAWMSSWKR